MRVIERFHEDAYYGTTDNFEIEAIADTGDQLGICSFNCQVDCPEDNNMERSFSDVFRIRELIRAAYEAGKAGEDLTFSIEEVDW